MANEYLQRTPTSTGNKRVFTWSGWVKKNEIQGGFGRFFESGAIGDRTYFTYTEFDEIRFTEQASSANRDSLVSNYRLRDSLSLCHVMIAVNSTSSQEHQRVKIYINGSLINKHGFSTGDPPGLNALFQHNESGETQYIGNSANQAADFMGSMYDVFHVDGQALTPDVFGFYKEGKGYESSGTTQATDFRPGQWSPHSPRTIKNAINRTGGFGVNGYYLPMNDSSNFGADFHCAPNSIIKLKGEDLPQPRNGAPTTSDAYVSELRSDPYAANLVLAVPGISTSTSATILSNGHFDSNTTGWTVGTATGTLVAANGELNIQRVSTNGTFCYQQITTEVGKRYTVSFDTRSSQSGSSYITKFQVGTTINGQELLSRIDTDSTTMVHHTASFTATGTTAYVTLGSNYTANSFWDNIVVKQEDVPRDYSADIKGSGSNKTLTPNGAAGVGYEIPGYYGSALSFGGSSDYFDAGSSSDFDFGSGDFTVEYWQNANSFASTPGLGIWDNVNNQRSWLIYQNSSSYPRFYVSTDGTSSVSINASLATPTNQWNHFCMERNGSNLVGYVNGVCVGVNTNLGTQSIFTPADPFLIGKWETSYYVNGEIQDLRVYKGVAKYKGSFDVSKPFEPVGIGTWRQTSDTSNGNIFATMNPLASTATHTNGNLTVQPSNSVNYSASISNLLVNSGKWYCELRFDEESTGNIIPGISELENLGFRDIYGGTSGTNFFGQSIDTNDTAGVRFNVTANDGDIVSMYMDLDSSPITCSIAVNGSSVTTYNSNDLTWNYNNLIPGRTYGFVAADAQSAVTGIKFTFNFGQNPTFAGQTTAGTYTDANGKGLFKYQPPAGYLALCEDNLPAPAIADPGEHFKSVLWTGDGNDGRSVTGVGFKPDLLWIKERNNATDHVLVNSILGASLYLSSNDPRAEGPYSSGPRSFDSDGFSLGNGGAINGNGDTYVAWCWKAGGPAVTNNDGSVASQVSVNQDAGFSIVSWTSDGTSLTAGHGLNKVPSLIIQKQRDASANWTVYHKDLAATEIVELNTDGAKQTSSDFANTRPTSSVLSSFTTGVSGRRVIAYCWTEIPGYSKIGSYRGTGITEGPYVQCGFKPAWVMVKNIDDTGGRDWGIQDSSKASSNPCNKQLKANQNQAENSGLADSTFQIDMLSNGFKVRNNTGIWNRSGDTIIFMAFAESPFQTANAK